MTVPMLISSEHHVGHCCLLLCRAKRFACKHRLKEMCT